MEHLGGLPRYNAGVTEERLYLINKRRHDGCDQRDVPLFVKSPPCSVDRCIHEPGHFIRSSTWRQDLAFGSGVCISALNGSGAFSDRYRRIPVSRVRVGTSRYEADADPGGGCSNGAVSSANIKGGMIGTLVETETPGTPEPSEIQKSGACVEKSSNLACWAGYSGFLFTCMGFSCEFRPLA